MNLCINLGQVFNIQYAHRFGNIYSLFRHILLGYICHLCIAGSQVSVMRKYL